MAAADEHRGISRPRDAPEHEQGLGIPEVPSGLGRTVFIGKEPLAQPEGTTMPRLLTLILVAVLGLAMTGCEIDTATTTATTAPPAVDAPAVAAPTTASPALVLEDFYLAADGETYYVEVSGVSGYTYCEAHLVGPDGRRTGEWTNELLSGDQNTVTLSLWDFDRSAEPDSVDVECSG